jgi:cytoplasmic iron level regulating protein YaaA (DUF328/UPF0246 family)
MLQKSVRALTTPKLKTLMGISDDLATLNRDRHQQLVPDPGNDQSRQAMFLFAGDVYRGLDAPSLPKDAVLWTQDHVGILSGLYGVVRPLDRIQPYRLEMGTSLKTRRGTSLYAYWDARIAKTLNTWSDEHGHKSIVNLASNEYFKAVSKKALARPVITPVFKDIKDGKARTLAFFAKKARGAMVRWAATHKPTNASELKTCTAMNYQYDDALSTETQWVFTREQPPPAGK